MYVYTLMDGINIIATNVLRFGCFIVKYKDEKLVYGYVYLYIYIHMYVCIYLNVCMYICMQCIPIKQCELYVSSGFAFYLPKRLIVVQGEAMP